MNRIIKKSIAFLLAFGMIFGQSAGSGVPQVYAAENILQNISGQNDCSDSEKFNELISELSTEDNLNITSNTTLQLNENSVYKYNNITISEGVKLTISGNGTLYATSVIGGQIAITGGNIYADTLKSKYGGLTISGGEVTANTISSGNATYDNPQGADLKISGGKVTVYKELLGGSSYYSQNCNGGNVYISNGEVNVYGIIQAGSGSGAPNSYYGGSGGNVKIYSNAKVYVEGTIQGGTGAKRGIFATYADRDKDSSRGGYVYIYSDTTVIGTVAGGSGGDGYSWNLCNGGHGGNVYIYGGNITGKIIGGKGGAGYNGYNDFAKGGNSGSVYFYGGIINAVDGIFVDNYGTGKYQGNYGTMYSSEDSQVHITASILPSREKFLSGIINCNGNIDVYGTQILASNQNIDSNNTLTVKDGASLTISGSILNVDGELINKGTVVINGNAKLTGSGNYTYNSSNTPISELLDTALADSLTIPTDAEYNGTDHIDSVVLSDAELNGIRFIISDSSDYNISVYYSEDGTQKGTLTEKITDAGYYTAEVLDSNGTAVASKSFTVSPKEIGVISLSLKEGSQTEGTVQFSGLAEGESLIFGTDYTLSDISVNNDIASGKVTLLDTKAARNYKAAEDGIFENAAFDGYTHVHSYTLKWNDEGHWQECLCGDKTDHSAHQPGTEATEDTAQTCTVCGYEIASNIIDKGTCGANLTWSLNNEGVLSISGTGKMTDYSYSSYAPWYENKEKVKTVRIDEGVTSLGNYAFFECTNLTTVSISDTIENIGKYCFRGCSFSEISLPESVITIGERAFLYCKKLTGIIIPHKVTKIEKGTFDFCSSLVEVVLPDEISIIDESAFCNCKKLSKINIPQNLQYIGDYAFAFCTNLPGIIIPEGVKSIGIRAFNSCDNMSQIAVDINNPYYTSEQGILYNKDKTTLIVSPAGNTEPDIIIPSSVTYISDDAFTGCKKMSHIIIPEGVTYIGDYAFMYCYGLTSISIPSSVTSIGTSAFYYCFRLSSMTITGGDISIGKAAFDRCDKLIHIHYPSSYASAEKFISDFVSACLPENANYYHINSNGFCESTNCPMGLSAPVHEHLFSEEWSSDETGHWHEPICNDTDEKKDFAKHISDDGIVTVQPTETSEGIMTYSCTVCGYVIRTESIPVLTNLPSITYESGDVETAEGLSADFSIKAKGEGLSFCWKQLVNGSFEDMGCTSESLHIETAADSKTFICVVTDKNGKTVTSSEFKLTVISIEDVSAEYVNIMSDEECIRFVNHFTSVNEDNFILTDGMMAAVQRVLIHDGIL